MIQNKEVDFGSFIAKKKDLWIKRDRRGKQV